MILGTTILMEELDLFADFGEHERLLFDLYAK